MSRSSGAPIRAARAGTVITNRWGDRSGWYVSLDHGGGYRSVYMHLRTRSYLRIGAHVSAGQVIGPVGATGDAKGPHLHFEIHRKGHVDPADDKDAINPAPFLRARGVRVGC